MWNFGLLDFVFFEDIGESVGSLLGIGLFLYGIFQFYGYIESTLVKHLPIFLIMLLFITIMLPILSVKAEKSSFINFIFIISKIINFILGFITMICILAKFESSLLLKIDLEQSMAGLIDNELFIVRLIMVLIYWGITVVFFILDLFIIPLFGIPLSQKIIYKTISFVLNKKNKSRNKKRSNNNFNKKAINRY